MMILSKETLGSGAGPYLEVTVNHPTLMQEADRLQHLLDHPAGVLLRVDASVQDTVEELTAGNTVIEETPSLITGSLCVSEQGTA